LNTIKHDWSNDPRLPLFFDFAQKEYAAAIARTGSKEVWIIGGTNASGSLSIELINADAELRQNFDRFLAQYKNPIEEK
jgi:hypothetical protein